MPSFDHGQLLRLREAGTPYPGPKYGLATWGGGYRWDVIPVERMEGIALTATPPLAMVRPINADIVDWVWAEAPAVSQ